MSGAGQIPQVDGAHQHRPKGRKRATLEEQLAGPRPAPADQLLERLTSEGGDPPARSSWRRLIALDLSTRRGLEAKRTPAAKRKLQRENASRLRRGLSPVLPLLLAVLVLFASGCCSGPRAAAVKYAQILRLDAADSSLPPQAREIARDAADAFEVQAWRLGGDEPSAEVLARANGTAPVISAPVHPDTPGRSK